MYMGKQTRSRTHKRKAKQFKYLAKHGGKSKSKSKRTKRYGKGKKVVFVDIGMSRPRITGAPGMNQNLEVSRELAKSIK